MRVRPCNIRRKWSYVLSAILTAAIVAIPYTQHKKTSQLEKLFYANDYTTDTIVRDDKQRVTIPSLTTANIPHDMCVFLLETSGKSELSPREWCAIESASRANPSLQITVLVLASTLELSPLAAALLRRNNTHVFRLDLRQLFQNTPLQNWYESKAVLRSGWPASHMSDAARFAILYKHGGIYLDTDVIVQRSLAELDDGAGLESEHAVAAGVLKFGRQSPLPGRLARRFVREFDPSDWGWNGPGVVTRELTHSCRLAALPLPATRCPGFTLFGRKRFYALHWPDWRLFLDPAARGAVIDEVSDSYVVHTWGSYTRAFAVGPGSAYYTLAERHCPLALKHGADKF